jgi:hypothetical protein
MAVAVG